MSDWLLRVRDIRFRLPTSAVRNRPGAGEPMFDGLNLDLEPGDVVAVTGPIGCGKTTLLRVLAGIVPPSSGTVERRGAVRFVSTGRVVDKRLPVADFLRLLHALAGFGLRSSKQETSDLLGRRGLADLAGVPLYLVPRPRGRQLLRLAASVEQPGSIAFIDERALGGRRGTARKVERLSVGAKAVVVVTSNERFIEKHCTKVIRLPARAFSGRDDSAGLDEQDEGDV